MKLATLLVCLAAVSQPLRIEQGATWSKSFDSDLDLTDCTLGMEIRDRSGGTLLAAPTLTETSLAAGTFTASLTANQTGQLVFRSAVYDVEATCGVTVHRLFEGSVSLSLGVTTDEVAPGEFPAPGTPPGSVYLSIADAATTYLTLADGVTRSTAQTITGQKTIAIDGNNDFLKFQATADKHMAVFYRYNNPTGDACWDVGTAINSQGAYRSNAWMIISGSMSGADAEGICIPQPASSLSSMLSVWSDLGAGNPAVEVRAAPIGSPGYLMQFMDRDGDFVLSIEEDGELQWGAGANHAAQDTTLYRSSAGVLRTDGDFRADGDLISSDLTTQSAEAMRLTSRMTNGSGGTAFTLTKENAGDDILLKLINGPNTALQVDYNVTLDANRGLGVNWAWKLGVIQGSESYPGLWFGSAVPSLSNYSFLYDSGGGGTSIVNGPASVALRVNNSTIASASSTSLSMASGKHLVTEVQVSATPSLSTCNSALRGAIVYVDDTDDGAAANLCFCGTDAANAYGWHKAVDNSACP